MVVICAGTATPQTYPLSPQTMVDAAYANRDAVSAAQQAHSQTFALRSDGVVPPVPLMQCRQPEYTEEARQARIQGTVVLDVEVEPDGTATVLGVVKSLNPGLDQRAIEAVSRWRFRPATRDGQPVKVSADVEVNFRLL